MSQVCGASAVHPHGGVQSITCEKEPHHTGYHHGWCQECELADDGAEDGWVPFGLLEPEPQEAGLPRCLVPDCTDPRHQEAS